jgi:hypothetical protein
VRVNGIPYYPVSAYHSSALCNVGRSSCRAGVDQSSAVVVNMSAPVEETLVGTFASNRNGVSHSE